MVFTDGRSNSRSGTITEAQRLKALPDLDQTVTVVAVGFGNVDKNEIQAIASSPANAIIAQGSGAAAGLTKLGTMLEQLVATVREVSC